jgi:hypothetical protein
MDAEVDGWVRLLLTLNDHRANSLKVLNNERGVAMTLIAAILPPDDPPFFIADTLVSTPGEARGRVLGPHGLILPKSGTEYRPSLLRQKTAILHKSVFAAYANSTFYAQIISKLAKGLSDAPPTAEKITEIVSEYAQELRDSETTIFVAFIDECSTMHFMTFGPDPLHSQLADGTDCYLAGSGTKAFSEAIESGRISDSGLVEQWPADNLLVMKLAGLIGRFASMETARAEFQDNFGGLIEIVQPTASGFEKMPSLSIITEFVTVEGDELVIWGGNYLDYCYEGDILVYRRFGQIRQEESKQAFGSERLVACVNPLHRIPQPREIGAAYSTVLSKPFEESTFNIFSWVSFNESTHDRMSIRIPDRGQFRINHSENQIQVFRSYKFLDELAKRFGATRVRIA